jgi:heterodisulfide reductase subunit C
MPVTLIKPNQVFYCFSDCGVCLTQCPIALRDPGFSPRRIVMQTVLGSAAELLEGADIWRCLSCGKCSYHCPAGIDFLGLIRELRQQALEQKAVARRSQKGSDHEAA